MNGLRFALRQLRYAPAFTVTALATIAICLGANLAIFAVIDAILLRSLPFPQSDRLVTIFNTYPKAGVERDGSSITNLRIARPIRPTPLMATLMLTLHLSMGWIAAPASELSRSREDGSTSPRRRVRAPHRR